MTAIDPNAIYGSFTPTQTSNQVTNPNASLGKDAFLKLLVAQLKYQDPMKPADPTEFMAQTAQFTMVEKIEELSQQFEATLTADRATMASSMIGKTIKSTINGTAISGKVTSVVFEASGPVLSLDSGRKVPLEAVQEVL